MTIDEIKADIKLGAPYKPLKPLKPYKPVNPAPISEYRAWVHGARAGQTIIITEKSFRYLPLEIEVFLNRLQDAGLIEIWVTRWNVKIRRTAKNV